jgi:hypothetical protein
VIWKEAVLKGKRIRLSPKALVVALVRFVDRHDVREDIDVDDQTTQTCLVFLSAPTLLELALRRRGVAGVL